MQGRQAQSMEGCAKPRGVNLKVIPGGRPEHADSQNNQVREGGL